MRHVPGVFRVAGVAAVLGLIACWATAAAPTAAPADLNGQVQMLLKSAPGAPEQWVARDVTFVLRLGGSDTLVLKRFDLRKPSHGAPPELRRSK